MAPDIRIRLPSSWFLGHHPPMKLRVLALPVALTACGPQGSPPSAPTVPGPPSSSPAPTPPAAPPPVSAAPAASASVSPMAAPPVCTSALKPERVLPSDVRALSVGRPPYVAILSDQPWMYDGKAWKELPIPKRLGLDPGEQSAIGIFFGRDDKPRVMGARWAPSSDAAHARQVYLRYREGAWQRDPKEIGRLGAGKDAGMYGVLGNDDPELVCKQGDACIIKRRTGWKTIPAAAELQRTWLCNGTVYVLDRNGMARLEEASFVPLAWQFEGRGAESGFWADSPSSWWVSAVVQGALYRFQDNAWSRQPAPVSHPAALWASSASDVWLVGEDGAARLEGGRWCRVEGISGPLEHVSGRNGEVWLGGKSGLWKVRLP
jgi:hypothetical protein